MTHQPAPPPAPADPDTGTAVLYNDTCPVCAFEIGHYRRGAARDGLALRFDPIARAADWGLAPDAAARRLHVRQDGRVLAGFAAFRALWAAMPGWRWLAWLTGLPVIRPLAAGVYDRLAAPLLYRAHLRRLRRGL
jgi:predicted DCC family thiol-disulfide oxidoreductase YuxK